MDTAGNNTSAVVQLYDQECIMTVNPHEAGPSSDSNFRQSVKCTVSYFKLFAFSDTIDCASMAVGALAAMAHGAALPVFFLFFGKLIDELGSLLLDPVRASQEVNKYALYFVYLGLVRFLSGWIEVWLWTYTGDRQAARLRTKYVRALLMQDVGFFDTSISTGEAAVGISNDTALIQAAIGIKTGSTIHYLSQCVAGFILSFLYIWRLTLLTLAVLPLIALTGGIYGYVIAGLSYKSQQAYVTAGEIAQEVLSQIQTVQAFVGENRAYRSYCAALCGVKKLEYRYGLAKGLGIGCNYGLGFASFALLLWYAGHLIRTGQATGGVAFTTVLNVIASSLALGQAAPEVATITKAKVSGYTILTMINRKPDISNNQKQGIKLDKLNGHLDFQDVHFSYPSRPDIPILDGFTLSIPAGQVVAIVGSSGSGKSTVISLVERFYDPSSGAVRLDGHDIRALQLNWLRYQMGLVNQEPALFSTTIRENISYGNCELIDVNVSDDDIIKAAKISCAHEFIQNLPNGYETEVGERGLQMSGGQKQRIAIARAMLRNPKILLLDEATSALDSESEQSVQNALENVMVGRTTVMVAHRLSTIQNADLIAVVQERRVAEIGSHAELLSRNGAYAVLVKMQEQDNRAGRNSAVITTEEKIITPASILNSARINPNVEDIDSKSGRRINSSFNSVTGSIISQPRAFSFRSINGSSFHAESCSVKNRASFKFESNEANTATAEREESSTGAPKPSMGMGRLFRMNARDWPYGVLSLVGAVVAGAQVPLFGLAITQALVYFNSPDREYMKQGLTKVTFMCCLVGFIAALAYTCQHYFNAVAGENVTMRIRKKMFSSMLKNEISWFDQNNSSVLATRLALDACLVRSTVVDGMVSLFQNLSLVITSLLITFNLQWKLSLVLLASLPCCIAANIGQYQFAKGLSGDLTEAYMKSCMVAGEAVSDIRTVAAFSAQDKIMKLFSHQLRHHQKQFSRRGFVAGIIFGFSQGIFLASYGAVMWYSGELIRQGQATFAETVKCIVILMVTSFSIAEALAMAPELLRGSEKLRPVFEILDRRAEIDGGDSTEPSIRATGAVDKFKRSNAELNGIDSTESSMKGFGAVDEFKIQGQIELCHVYFSYPTRPSAAVLKGLSLKIGAGSSLALVGSSGSGKSSVISLISRFYDPDNGAVKIDGRDIREINPKDLRRRIGLVQQEPALFSASIYENIKYGNDAASEAEVVAAAKAAGAHGFISALPGGYGTAVGERGVKLSGGQKQRVAIARAVVRNPVILLLDEATSALDAQCERAVQEALDKIMLGRTTVIVAHRLSTIQNAHSIAVLQSGSVVEQGSHGELLANEGPYFHLLNLGGGPPCQ